MPGPVMVIHTSSDEQSKRPNACKAVHSFSLDQLLATKSLISDISIGVRPTDHSPSSEAYMRRGDQERRES